MSGEDHSGGGKPDQARRRLLVRLGLAAVTAYAAPVMLNLSHARASGSGGSGSGGGGGGGGRNSGGRGSAPSSPRRPRRAQPRRIAAAPRPEIVVTAPATADIDRIVQAGFTLQSRSRLELLGSELARFSVPSGLSLDQARQRILEIAPAALFDLNHVYRTSELSCGDDSCAAFDMIGWKSAAHACPANTVVGMIDTGVNGGHDALEGVDIEIIPAIGRGREPASRTHGTAIAVLIGGRSDARTPGLLSGVRLIAAEAFHRDAGGQDAADAFDVARAIDRLIGRGARVINMSFAGPPNALLKAVVDMALKRDAVLVAAGGNAGPNAEPLYPAAYEGVVAVTAVDRESRVYRQANAGDHIDFAAPGVRLWTAASVSGGRYRSGTSYATPFVSAVLAAARAREPSKSAREIVAEAARGVTDLGEPGRDATYGWGLVQSVGACGLERTIILPASENPRG